MGSCFYYGFFKLVENIREDICLLFFSFFNQRKTLISIFHILQTARAILANVLVFILSRNIQHRTDTDYLLKIVELFIRRRL